MNFLNIFYWKVNGVSSWYGVRFQSFLMISHAGASYPPSAPCRIFRAVKGNQLNATCGKERRLIYRLVHAVTYIRFWIRSDHVARDVSPRRISYHSISRQMYRHRRNFLIRYTGRQKILIDNQKS